MKRHLKNKRLVAFIVLLVIFIGSGFGLLFMDNKAAAPARTSTSDAESGSSDNASQQTTPARTTELSFIDQAKLPTTYTPAQDLTVSFKVRNLEGKDMTYHYQITVNGDVYADHELPVKHKVVQNVENTFALPDKTDKLTVRVTLLEQNKSIQFNLNPAQ